MIPTTPLFVYELAFWLIAGFFACELFTIGSSLRENIPGGALHGMWVILATGRVELACTEWILYLVVERQTKKIPFNARLGLHLFRQLLWLMIVVWWWPR